MPGTVNPQLILVSQSPRRRRLLEWLGLPFASAAVQTPEELDSPLATDPPSLAIALASEKSEAARAAGMQAGEVLLCFDTIVVLDGEVLGKPADSWDAWRMLRALRGREHQVVTGAAMLAPAAAGPETFSVATNVAMSNLSDAEIADWMTEGTFMGCAGAYNIEAQVARVADDECYQNVAGLPLCHLYAELVADPALRDLLPQTPTSPIRTCNRALGRSCRIGPRIIST